MNPAGSGTIAFGPVPSRRLGRSLGINNIPPKICSYSCIYCQVGVTDTKECEPRPFYPPHRVLEEVSEHLAAVRARGEPIDFLTFVPDGEPTLDSALGETIRLLTPLRIPIAVISNGTLLDRPEVQAALHLADWVSVKVDAVTETIWRRVNHPHPGLQLEVILEGIRSFAADFDGDLCTETMLVSGVNDSPGSLTPVAAYLAGLDARTSYLSIPTRPPALPGVRAPTERSLNRAYQLLAAELPRVEYLIGDEGEDFATTGDVGNDILATTAVHPLRESAVAAMLEKSHAPWRVVNELLSSGVVRRVEYRGERYYLRSYHRSPPPQDSDTSTR
jgi:wyosine [tRNA(Phe)-imidazoG37] synthetase (radical SAM superfamily)